VAGLDHLDIPAFELRIVALPDSSSPQQQSPSTGPKLVDVDRALHLNRLREELFPGRCSISGIGPVAYLQFTGHIALSDFVAGEARTANPGLFPSLDERTDPNVRLTMLGYLYRLRYGSKSALKFGQHCLGLGQSECSPNTVTPALRRMRSRSHHISILAHSFGPRRNT